MKPLFIKKNGTVSKVSGIIMNLIPSYTLAEYNALTHKPLFWVRTDEEYAQIPATDVSYGSGSVKDALDNTVSKSNGGTFGGNVTIDSHNGTTSAEGYSALALGNNIPQGTAGNARGQLFLYGNGSHWALLMPGSLTADRHFNFPDKGGTIALTDDIHGIKDSVNVSAENLDTYTTPGTYCVYLTSAVSPLTQGSVYVLEVLGIKFNKATLGFIQRLTSIYPNDAKIIQRAYYGAVGGWGAWREI